MVDAVSIAPPEAARGAQPQMPVAPGAEPLDSTPPRQLFRG
jgi:hypothetical protein